jgi:hypothetical protein
MTTWQVLCTPKTQCDGLQIGQVYIGERISSHTIRIRFVARSWAYALPYPLDVSDDKLQILNAAYAYEKHSYSKDTLVSRQLYFFSKPWLGTYSDEHPLILGSNEALVYQDYLNCTDANELLQHLDMYQELEPHAINHLC